MESRRSPVAGGHRINERGLPQIGAVQPKQIESEKYRAASTVQKLFELAHTAGIEGDDLSV
jgi:hypothetical protein